jgi:hypothetical protein
MSAEATPFMDYSDSAKCSMYFSKPAVLSGLFFSKINQPVQKKKNKKIIFISQFLLTGCKK